MSRCQSCGNEFLQEILDLGDMPICNAFTSPGEKEEVYPLKLVYCGQCSLVQLSEVPPASKVFGPEFNYLTGSSKENVEYYDKMAERLIERFRLTEKDLVLDIASNDGTFLKGFQRRGIKVIGVEPAIKVAQIAEEAGIPTFHGRFEDAPTEIWNPTLITAMDVLAHTDTPHEFLDKLVELMKRSKAFFVSQHQEVTSMLRQGTFDSIYHEHARFYSFESLQYLFKLHGLSIYDSTHTDYYGGSILAFAMPSDNIPNLLAQFQSKAERTRWELQGMVTELLKEGKRIAGISAPMRSSTLLNFCGFGPSEIEYLCETNALKIGKLAPGSKIPVYDDAYFFAHPPDVAIVLSWNLAEGIMKRFRAKGYSRQFLLPFPSPRLV